MTIGIIGSGAMGIAFANTLCSKADILMWTKFEEEKERICSTRENSTFLPGITLSDNIAVTTDISLLKNTHIIVLAVPFVAIRDVMDKKNMWYNSQIVISVIKGVEDKSFKTTTQILSEYINLEHVCVVSGPSFAVEIAKCHPIHLMLASQNKDLMCDVSSLFKGTCIRLHETDDMTGVELCGAIKNAIAIGAGMLHGLNEADSTKAAYLATR